MFILCPHCQFLVAIDPASGLPPASCPRCGQALHAKEAAGTPAAPPEPDAPAGPPAAPEAPPVPAADAVAPERSVDADVLGEMFAQAHAEGEPPAGTTDLPAPPAFPDAPPPDAASMSGAQARPAAQDIAVAPSPVAAPAPVARARAPSFARNTADAVPAARRWPALAALAALSLLLAVQLLLADRAQLAMDARWRPTLDALCGALRCTLPAWHEPDAFTLVARDVRPVRAGVLHVTATFRNDARWRQAWPALHLALQDVDGRTIGARVFAPADYLGHGRTQNGVAPGQVASVAFDVGEPPGTVVAFTFDFR